MIQDKNLTDNPHIQIIGQHIEFITSYSFDMCLNRLDDIQQQYESQIRKKSPSIQLTRLDDQSARFVMGHRWSKNHLIHTKSIKGTITTYDDQSTCIQATVPPVYFELSMVGLALSLMLLIILLAVGWSEILPFVIIFGIVAVLFILEAFAFQQSRTQHMQALIVQVLYKSPEKII